MAEKRVLIADADAEALEGFRQALSPQCLVTWVKDGNEALAEMKKQPSDVVVADLDLPGLNGAELLNRIREEFPKTVLFILGTDADKERVMKNVLGAHQFLTKPCNGATLKSAVERALALDVWVASSKMRELVARVRTFPTVPSLYIEVLGALRSADATTAQVGSIIAKDMAMTTKLLQVLNSAYFGLSRKVTDPSEAVGILGFDAVKSMVMTLKLLSQYDQIKPVYFSVDQLWRHSTQVAKKAKQLTALVTNDSAMAESAFTAGLVHDLGKIVLASNFDEQYRGVQSLATRQQLPLWEVEKEIFGAHHGEIGAYLLGLWGMPLDLLEASALHHQPGLSTTKSFNPLTAVHIANAWEHEVNPGKDGLISSKIDEAYAASLGITDKLGGWRTAVYQADTGKAAASSATKSKSATTKIATAKATPVAAAAPTKTKSPAAPKPTQVGRAWHTYSRHNKIMAGAALAASVIILAGMLAVYRPRVAEPFIGAPMEVRARSLPDGATVDVSVPPSAPGKSQAEIAPAKQSLPAAAVAPKPLGFSDLKLQGIFFSARQPSAIINGNLVHPNDHVAGARVVNISVSTVTLEYQNQRKTLTLK